MRISFHNLAQGSGSHSLDFPFSSQEGTLGASCHLSFGRTIEEVLDLFSARLVAEFILFPASHHHRHLRDTGRLWKGRTGGPSVTG